MPTMIAAAESSKAMAQRKPRKISKPVSGMAGCKARFREPVAEVGVEREKDSAVKVFGRVVDIAGVFLCCE